MGQVTQFYPNVANSPAAAGVINIPASLMPQGRIVQYDFMFGAAATLAAVARMLLYAGGIPIVNVPCVGAGAGFDMWGAYIGRFFGNCLNPASADFGFPAPLFFGDEVGQLERDSCQCPPNLPMSAQLTMAAGSLAAGVDVLATVTDVEPSWTPLIQSSAMGIAAIQANRPYDPKTSGLLRGFGINPVGLTNLFFNIGQVQVTNGQSGPALVSAQKFKREVPGATGAVVNPIFTKTLPWRPMNAGGTMLQITTGAGWAVGVNGEFCTYCVVPIEKGVPTMPLMAGSPS